jgi:hypothetical protein
MSFESLVPFMTFLAIALGVWATLSVIAEKQARASNRLERLLKQTAQRQGPTQLLRRQDRLQNLVARAAPALSKPLQPKSVSVNCSSA